MKVIWFEEAWDDYLYWQTQDKKTLQKVNRLLKDIDRNRYDCMGKFELLKEDLSGWASCRIDQANRIVFRIEENKLIITQCRGHYKK